MPSSVPEAGPLIQAGRVKGLAVFGSERLEAFPDVPTLKEETGLENALGAWRGVVGPQGLDADVADQLEAALAEIVQSEDWQAQMTDRGFGIEWKPSDEFEAFMRGEESSVREIVGILGL